MHKTRLMSGTFFRITFAGSCPCGVDVPPGAQHPAAARHPNCVIGASCHDDSMFVVKRRGCLNS